MLLEFPSWKREKAKERKSFGTTAVDLHPIVLAYRTRKKSIGLINERVISSSENYRAHGVKDGRKLMDKRVRSVRVTLL